MKFLVLTLALALGAVACNRDERSSDVGTGAKSDMEAEMAPEEIDAPAGTDSDMGSGSSVDHSDHDHDMGSGTDMGSGASSDQLDTEESDEMDSGTDAGSPTSPTNP